MPDISELSNEDLLSQLSNEELLELARPPKQASTMDRVLDAAKPELWKPAKEALSDPYNAAASGMANVVGSISGNLAHNLDSLARAGIGSVANLVGRPDMAPDIVPPEHYPLTAQWLKRRMREEGTLRDVEPGVVKNVGESAGAGAMFGPTGALAGAFGGLGQSAAESFFPDNPVASLIGNVAGSFTPAAVQKAAGYVPRKILATQETPVAVEGQAIENATGVKLSLGQKSGNRRLSSVEHGLKEGSDDAAKLFDKQTKDAENHLTAVAQQFSKKPAEGLTVKAGEELGQAYDQAVKRYETIRTRIGRVEYGKWRHEVGDGPQIGVSAFEGKLRNLADVAVPGSVEAKAAADSVLKTLTAQIKKGGGKLTAEQYLDWQQKINRELFQNVEKAGRGRIQRELLDALFADGNAYSGKAADQLQKAIGMWRRGSTLLTKFEESVPASVFGMRSFDPYNAAAKIEKLSPSQIAATRKAVDRHPSAWDDTVAAWVYRGMEKASNNPNRLAGQSPFSPSQFLQQLPKRDQLNAMVPDGKKRDTLMNGFKLMERVADKYGGGSQGMGVRQTFADVASNMVGGNPIFIARLAGKYLGPIGLGKLLMTDGGHKTLRSLAAAPDKSPAKAAAIEQFIQLMEEEKTQNGN